MKFLARAALSLASNIIAILGASYLLADFVFEGAFIDLLIVAGALTGINIFVRPVIKLILGPLIVLTLGLAVMGINIFIVYLLDFLIPGITINGLIPLIISALIISAVNFLIDFSAKTLYNK